MKKLILLALVALVAGAAFASTDPAFSGTFEYSTQFDFTNKEFAQDDGGGEAVVNLNGVVDEWSTVNVEMQADSSGPLSLNQFTLTTDVTGALGASGPVAFSLTWGAITHKAAIYQSKAGYGDNEPQIETESYLGAKLVLTIVDKIVLIASVMPGTYLDAAWVDGDGTGSVYTKAVFGVEAQFNGLVEGLDANIWYISDENPDVGAPGSLDREPPKESQLGVSAGYGSDMFDAGFVFIGNMTSDVYGAGVSAKYKMDVFDLGAALALSDFSDLSGAGNFNLGLNATWKAVTDTLDVFVAATFDFNDFGSSGYEGGVKFYLGATTYVLGYDYQNAGYEGPKNTTAGGAYLKVSADY